MVFSQIRGWVACDWIEQDHFSGRNEVANLPPVESRSELSFKAVGARVAKGGWGRCGSLWILEGRMAFMSASERDLFTPYSQAFLQTRVGLTLAKVFELPWCSIDVLRAKTSRSVTPFPFATEPMFLVVLVLFEFINFITWSECHPLFTTLLWC